MAKIILLYVVTLFMIFPLFWNHGNATTPRKLGTRHNAVTGMTNTGDATFRGLGFARELGSRKNTNEPISSGLLGHNDSPISSSLGQGERQFGIPCLSKTKLCDIRTPRFSHFKLVSSGGTPVWDSMLVKDKLSSAHSTEATSGGSEDHDPPISRSTAHSTEATSGGSEDHDSPILRSSAYSNEATSGGSEDHDSPISRSLDHANKATSGGSEDRDSPISRSSAHANKETSAHATEATSDGSEDHDSPISRSSAHATEATSGGSEDRDSPILRSSAHSNEATSGGSEDHNSLISRSSDHANEATSGGSEDRDSILSPFQACQLK
ncbi:hypothetical protein FXO37_10458 [Capsicum annuum]|nr:hypothetical protein FXO37_10458 [Capsicum annuum]